MKRFMSFFLTVAIALYSVCTSASATEDASLFNDVYEQDYFYDAVRWAVKDDVTGGVTQTLFKPADTCSRAQVVTFLWRASGKPEPTDISNPFKDVKETDYFYKSVLWAVEKGITGGASADLFAPSQRCTRAHALTFLWRAFGSPELENESSVAEQYSGQYFEKALQWADDNGLVWEDVGGFSPYSKCPRADIVTYIYTVKGQSSNTHISSLNSWGQHIDRYFYMKLVGEYANSYYTKSSALKISSAAQLAAFASFSNSSPARNFSGKYVVLMDDIDIGAYEWAPICKPQERFDNGTAFYNGGGFMGTFDGDGYSVQNLQINKPTKDILGLFGAINCGEVNNTSITGEISGDWNIGGIAAYNMNGKINNCDSGISVKGNGYCIGGIVGQNCGGRITGCAFSGKINGNRTSSGNIGGIAGWTGASGTIEQCISCGTVCGYFRVGGIAGRLQSDGYITDCVCTSKVSGVRYYDIFVGMNDAGIDHISGCTIS